MSRKRADGLPANEQPKPESTNLEKVRVVCRIRPLLQRELDVQPENAMSPLKIIDANTIEVYNDKEEHAFIMDRVYGIDTSQLMLYEETCFPLVQDALNGYNATIFAYGQTGTGKTFTMEGDIDDINRKGIIPRSFESLYQTLYELHSSIEYSVKVSYIEIYMEKIKDLLQPTRSNSELVIREDKIKGVYIAGVTEATVQSHEELLNIMTTGSTNRVVASTKMNEASSRSHSVFSITVALKNTSTLITKVGKLVLVDLAGSEMVKKTNAQGQQLEEAKTINKSLSALGQVINALASEKQGHIPFRDSKLTRILQDSLGGNSRTVLVVNISASIFDTSETLSTLRFGMRAKGIQTRVTLNQLHRSVEELELLLKTKEEIIDTLLIEIESLKQENLAQNADAEQQLKQYAETLSEKQVELEHVQTSKTLDDTRLIEGYIVEVAKLNEDLLLESNAKTDLMKQIQASDLATEALQNRIIELEKLNMTLAVSSHESDSNDTSEVERLKQNLYDLQLDMMKQSAAHQDLIASLQNSKKLLSDELLLYKTKSTQALERESELLLNIDRLQHNLDSATSLMRKERETTHDEIKTLRGRLFEVEDDLEYKKRALENGSYELEKSKLKLIQVESELADLNRIQMQSVEKADKFQFEDVYDKEEEGTEVKHNKVPARMAFAMRSPNILPQQHAAFSSGGSNPSQTHAKSTKKSIAVAENPSEDGGKWTSNPLSVPQRSTIAGSLAATESPVKVKKSRQRVVEGVAVIDDNDSDISRTTSVAISDLSLVHKDMMNAFNVFGENFMAGFNVVGESINGSLDAVGESIGETTGGIVDLTSTIDTISSPFLAIGSLFGVTSTTTTDPIDVDGVAQELDFAGVYKNIENE